VMWLAHSICVNLSQRLKTFRATDSTRRMTWCRLIDRSGCQPILEPTSGDEETGEEDTFEIEDLCKSDNATNSNGNLARCSTYHLGKTNVSSSIVLVHRDSEWYVSLLNPPKASTG
jgi:hypothetical protein